MRMLVGLARMTGVFMRVVLRQVFVGMAWRGLPLFMRMSVLVRVRMRVGMGVRVDQAPVRVLVRMGMGVRVRMSVLMRWLGVHRLLSFNKQVFHCGARGAGALAKNLGPGRHTVKEQAPQRWQTNGGKRMRT
jgi:hypothetical protein